jgi:hypothetical protein
MKVLASAEVKNRESMSVGGKIKSFGPSKEHEFGSRTR